MQKAKDDLEKKFSEYVQRLKDVPFNVNTLSGTPRWKLYGLQKQALEGNCKQPCPPKENFILTSKWESWSSFRGLSKEDAMHSFIAIFEEFVKESKMNIAAALPMNTIRDIVKEGVLYVQKDVFDGWREKVFMLNDSLLVEKCDVPELHPRKPFKIPGCTVVRIRPITTGEHEYFPFVVSHPRSSDSYNLSCLSEKEREDWIMAIESCANPNTSTDRATFRIDKDSNTSMNNGNNTRASESTVESAITKKDTDLKQPMRISAQITILLMFISALYFFFPRYYGKTSVLAGLFTFAIYNLIYYLQSLLFGTKKLISNAKPITKSKVPVTSTVPVGGNSSFVNRPTQVISNEVVGFKSLTAPDAHLTIFEGANIPEEYLTFGQRRFQQYGHMLQSSDRWEPYFEEDEVVAFKYVDTDNLVCIRGEGMIRASPVKILEFILDINSLPLTNPNVTSTQKLKVFSNHAFARMYTTRKQTFAPPRYTTQVVHWCATDDNRILMHCWTQSFPDVSPPPECSFVEVHYQAMIFEPRGTDGSHVTIVMKVDGKAPSFITTSMILASSNSKSIALTIAKIRDCVTKDYDGVSPINTSYALEELEAIGRGKVVGLNRESPVTDEEESAISDVTPLPNINPPLVSSGIPIQYVPKAEATFRKYFSYFELGSESGWESWFNEDGVVAHRKTEDSIMCARGEGPVPVTLLQLFRYCIDAKTVTTSNPKVVFAEKLTSYSNHAWARMIKFEKAPFNIVAQRYFVEMMNWCMLEDGRVLIHSWSENLDDLCPPEDQSSMCKAIFHYNAMILESRGDAGCYMTYVAKVDLNGTLPSGIVTMALKSIPLGIANGRRALQAKYRGPIVNKFTFNDLESIADEIIMGKKNNSASTEITMMNMDPVNAHLTPVVVVMPPFLIIIILALSHRYLYSFAILSSLYIMKNYIEYLILGPPTRKSTSSASNSSEELSGKVTLRFPLDLGKLLHYIELKKVETGIEIKLTHLATKAAGMVLKEMPSIRGYLINGKFYRSRENQVDVSVSAEVKEHYTTLFKITNVDSKSLDAIAEEMYSAISAFKAAIVANSIGIQKRILNYFPLILQQHVKSFFDYLGHDLGLKISYLGIESHPFGMCSIVTSLERDGEGDLDIVVTPEQNVRGSPPIVVTVGGIRVQPSLDTERKISGSPVINAAVSVNCKAVSITEARKFSYKFQQLLNTPSNLDA